MTRNFYRWEVDPFFQAAEEVQDSADRLESVYRAWLHAKSVDAVANDSIVLENHRRELSTALGTAKWQLEDFERAVSYLDVGEQQITAADVAPARHKQFVDALQNQINLIETTLLNSGDSRDSKALPVVQLRQEERDDLALFLCGSKSSAEEDSKRTGFFESAPSSSGKGDDEAFCTSSESIKSKNEVSDCFSTSASNSDMASNKADFQKLDHLGRLHERGWTDKNIKDFLDLEVQADQSRKFLSKPSYKQLHGDEGRLSVSSEDVPHRVSDLLKDSGASYGRIKSSKELKNTSKYWLPFTKKSSAFDLSMSRSGFKRWKDGDANSKDHSLLLQFIYSSSDLEKGEESSFAGDSLKGLRSGGIGGHVNCRSTFFNFGCKALNETQHLISSLSTNPHIQRALAVLIVLGFIGFILFRVA